MILGPERYTTVPWLLQSDLEEGRRCLWELEYRRDEDRASCWQIDDPFQNVASEFLVVHAVRGNGNDGGLIALAISETPRYDVYAADSFHLARVHPRRHDEADGA